jgi:hypothetical protein
MSTETEIRMQEAIRTAGRRLEVTAPGVEEVRATHRRRAQRSRSVMTGLVVLLVGGVVAVTETRPAPTAVVDAPQADVVAEPVAAAGVVEGQLDAEVEFRSGDRVAIDPVTRVRGSVWSGPGALVIDGVREEVQVELAVDVDAEGSGPYDNAAFRGTVEVTGETTTCTGPFAAVWDDSDEVADRGAMALRCTDDTVLGLTVDGFDTSGTADVFSVAADGFAVRGG